jgi:hypothetical protein
VEEFSIYISSVLELSNGITVVVDSDNEVAANSEPGIPVLVESV